ncbi:MAG: AmmeMemoRadiSam system radical SAM enzyme [Thermoplasmatales archaeon]|nr:AmmeMemoRadiSam system radical SAM enzyme [Thermoplasmatales archaeon]
MEKEAKFWVSKGEKVQCNLCPHRCVLKEGERGICGVRKASSGKLFTLIYASAFSACPDPIEKKPLFHFYPGSLVYSLGSVGCNLKCMHCQNFSISQALPEEYYLEEILPHEAIERAKRCCDGIAWTYNEPTIWVEYAVDCAKIAKKEGLYTVFVTNGYINEDAIYEVSKYVDAANIDVKSMSKDFYKKICGGKLEPVLDACKSYKSKGVHVEITYLVIPTKNDDKEEIKKFCKWVLENLGNEQVIHFTAFYPHYKMSDLPPTPLKKLLEAYGIAREEGFHYVYLGNVPHGEYENTYCPTCKNLLIERHGFSSQIVGLKEGKCSKCGEKIKVIMK